MTKCVPIDGGFLCMASVDRKYTKRIECPWELRPRKCLIEVEDWYGATVTCLSCGFQYGERLPTLSRSELADPEKARDRAKAARQRAAS